jgi:hypothetical protein
MSLRRSLESAPQARESERHETKEVRDAPGIDPASPVGGTRCTELRKTIKPSRSMTWTRARLICGYCSVEQIRLVRNLEQLGTMLHARWSTVQDEVRTERPLGTGVRAASLGGG